MFLFVYLRLKLFQITFTQLLRDFLSKFFLKKASKEARIFLIYHASALLLNVSKSLGGFKLILNTGFKMEVFTGLSLSIPFWHNPPRFSL